jgi:hypothetical protein
MLTSLIRGRRRALDGPQDPDLRTGDMRLAQGRRAKSGVRTESQTDVKTAVKTGLKTAVKTAVPPSTT